MRANHAEKERGFAGPVQIPCFQLGLIVVEKWRADGASPAFPLLVLIRLAEKDEPVGASIADLAPPQIPRKGCGFRPQMRQGGARGKSTWKVALRPGTLSAQSRPPCRSTICREM